MKKITLIISATGLMTLGSVLYAEKELDYERSDFSGIVSRTTSFLNLFNHIFEEYDPFDFVLDNTGLYPYTFEQAVKDYTELSEIENPNSEQKKALKKAKAEIRAHRDELIKEKNASNKKLIELKEKYNVKTNEKLLKKAREEDKKYSYDDWEDDNYQNTRFEDEVQSLIDKTNELPKSIASISAFIDETSSGKRRVSHSLSEPQFSENGERIVNQNTKTEGTPSKRASFKDLDKRLDDLRILMLDIRSREFKQLTNNIKESLLPVEENIRHSLAGYYVNGQIRKALGNICEFKKTCEEASDKNKTQDVLRKITDALLKSPQNSRVAIPNSGDYARVFEPLTPYESDIPWYKTETQRYQESNKGRDYKIR